MKRKITTLLASCLLLAGTSFAQNTLNFEVSPQKHTTRSSDANLRTGNEHAVFSYATLNFDNINAIGTGKNNTSPQQVAAVIDIPKDVYNGQEIAGATVHISDFEGTLPSSLKLILIDADTKKLIVEKEAETVKSGFNTIMLDEPIAIENGKIYQVGYIIPVAKGESNYWLSFDADAPSIPQSNRLLIGSATMPTTWDFQDQSPGGFGSLAIFALINDTDGTWKDAAVINKFKTNRFSELGDASAKIHVTNRGTADITSVKVSYKIGDGNDVEKTIKPSEAIAPGHSLPIDIMMTFSDLGFFTVTAKPISVNESGNNPTENEVAAITVVESVGGSTTMNSVLYERFTTEACVNCPASDRPEELGREQLQESGIKVSRIAHHVGYRTDWLTNSTSSPLLNLLHIKGAPSLAINRYVTDAGKYNLHPASTEASVELARESMKHTTAEITTVTQAYDKDSKKLTVKVGGKSHANIDEDNLFVNIVITESGLKAKNQAGATGTYIHDDVPRVFATGTYGEKVTITDGTFSFEVKDIEISDKYITENLKVVVFLSRNLQPTDYAWNINVYGAETLLFGSGLSTEDVSNQAEVFVTSRDGAIVIEGEYNSVLVYDLAGRQVAQTGLAAGVYIVRVETPQGVAVRKVAVR